MTVEGSVHYGDSVLVIGRVGSLALRVRGPGRAGGGSGGARVNSGWDGARRMCI